MGSPSFAVPTLEALVGTPHFEVVRVVTQPDRPSGRGKKLTPTAVHLAADRYKLAVVCMSKKNYAAVAAELAALKPDFIVVAAFGLILRSDLLGLPARGCINLHASLLPKYRGMSPIQSAILAGETHTGCTTMQMDEGVDTGDVLLQSTTEIHPRETAGELEERLAKLGADLIVRTLQGILSGSVARRPQDHSRATHTHRVLKEHGRIRWEESAAAIDRRIRAMQPWPSAYTIYGGRRVIILDARPVAAPSSVTLQLPTTPATILTASPLVVAAGDGALEILRLKVEGKRDMTAAAFVSGYRARAGDRFGE
jgi:methionyl-tRNA formyltransferase